MYWYLQYRFQWHHILNHTAPEDNNYIIDSQCNIILFTSVDTAPGLFILIFLTVWNTSTTPSVLHCSIALLTAQYTPERLTVSLKSSKNNNNNSNNNYVSMYVYLQCTTTGPSPLLCCVVMTRSNIFMTVWVVVTFPLSDQSLKWNWTTLWELLLWKKIYQFHWMTICVYYNLYLWICDY